MSLINRIRPKVVNAAMLLRIMGWLLIIEGIFMLVPGIVAFCYEEHDWWAFAGPSFVTTLVGLVLSHKAKPKSQYLGKRDGFLLTASVWIVFSIFGLVPFLLCDLHLSYSDAFFEAMAGFTTSGASVLNSTGISHGVHIWRAMMQWIGGMGIILFTLAIIPMLNHSGGMQMFNAEVTGITHDKIRPRISQTAKSLWLIYIGLTAILVLLLWLGPMSFFESVCHAFATVSTGGYSTSGDSINEWYSSPYVKLVITFFMFAGGVNFGLIFRAIRGDGKALVNNEVFRTYIMIIGGAFVLYVIAIAVGGNYTGWQSVTVDPLFQVVSTLTSTGYSVTGFENWGSFVLALTIVMMFFGACAGSTSGGAKIDRIIYLFKNVRNELYRCLYPNAILAVKINGKVVNPDLVNKVIAFLSFYILLTVGGGIALAVFGVPLVDAFFSAFSCISNTGFGAGITGYGNDYEMLPDVVKWILSALMLIGRLEIFTVLILFTPSFWRH